MRQLVPERTKVREVFPVGLGWRGAKLLFDEEVNGRVLRYRGEGVVAVCVGWAAVESAVAFGVCVAGKDVDKDGAERESPEGCRV